MTEFNQANNVSLTLKRIRFSNIEKIQLPIVYFDKEYGSVVLANLSTDKALIQSPDAASPEIISREELEVRWSGEVILNTTGESRFDVSWFIPAFVHHRHLIGEVLLFSLMLQFLALATPLFFQVVMDKVFVHKALSTLDVLVVVLVVVGIFEVIFRGLREYLFAL
nr:cysteine peptidase family C39 domain-containing protein [Vibrio aestuarianus]